MIQINDLFFYEYKRHIPTWNSMWIGFYFILLISSPQATALTGDWLLNQESYQLQSLIDSDQSRVVSDFKSKKGFKLEKHALEELIGIFDVNLHDIVRAIDPEFFRYWQQNLGSISLNLAEDYQLLGVHHKTFVTRLNDIDILDSYVRTHVSSLQGLVMVRWDLPPIECFQREIQEPLFDALEAFTTAKVTQQMFTSVRLGTKKPIFIIDRSLNPPLLTPAWQVTGTDSLGQVVSIFVHGLSGDLLYVKHDSFGMANQTASVFDKNPKDGKMIETDMPHLNKTGFLDSKFFSVFGAKEPSDNAPASANSPSSSRAQMQNNSFPYSAFKAQDSQAFDQVQTYFFALRSLQWLWDKFGLDPMPEKNFLSIYVGGTINSRYDNAMYVPNDTGASILIAQNQKLENLARDRDVVTHELAHHIIYRGIKSSAGESGVLHEGTADYLTYVQSGDPYLAESIVPGAPYLRTALIEPQEPFEKIGKKMTNHAKGQYWSSLLWTLGEEIGHDRVLQLIRSMLHYVGPKGGIRDAIAGLIRADRDWVQQASNNKTFTNSEIQSEECRILEKAVYRGFGHYLSDINISEMCGLHLPAMTQGIGSKEPAQGSKGSSLAPMSKFCGTIIAKTKVQNAANLSFALIFLIPLFIPLIIGFSSRRSRDHGS